LLQRAIAALVHNVVGVDVDGHGCLLTKVGLLALLVPTLEQLAAEDPATSWSLPPLQVFQGNALGLYGAECKVAALRAVAARRFDMVIANPPYRNKARDIAAKGIQNSAFAFLEHPQAEYTIIHHHLLSKSTPPAEYTIIYIMCLPRAPPG